MRTRVLHHKYVMKAIATVCQNYGKAFFHHPYQVCYFLCKSDKSHSLQTIVQDAFHGNSIYSHILWQKSTERKKNNFFKFVFADNVWSVVWTRALYLSKPIHYALDHYKFSRQSKQVKFYFIWSSNFLNWDDFLCTISNFSKYIFDFSR